MNSYDLNIIRKVFSNGKKHNFRLWFSGQSSILIEIITLTSDLHKFLNARAGEYVVWPHNFNYNSAINVLPPSHTHDCVQCTYRRNYYRNQPKAWLRKLQQFSPFAFVHARSNRKGGRNGGQKTGKIKFIKLQFRKTDMTDKKVYNTPESCVALVGPKMHFSLHNVCI